MKNITSIFKKSLLNIAILSALTGGVVMQNVAIAADESMPAAHSNNLGAAITDTAITAKVKSKLMGQEGLKNSDISVKTTNGVVTLTGSATSSKAKTLAEESAQSIEGVKNVDNDLHTPSGSKMESKTKKAVEKTERVASDSWITTKVKSELLVNSLTKGVDVKVKTLNGVVVLKGSLPNQEAINEAKNIAEKIEGVKSVNSSALTLDSK